MRSVAQFFTIAGYELIDAFRSKRAIILLILYLMGSIGASLVFINVLHKIERQTVEAMGLTPSDEPGATTRTLWKSKHFEKMMIGLVGDKELAQRLLSIPPVSLFYSWLALTFTPLLVMLMASSRIAEDVSTASVRFVLFRTSRSTWCLGKFAGQSLMLAVALLLSGLGTWGHRMDSNEIFRSRPSGLAHWALFLKGVGLCHGVPWTWTWRVAGVSFPHSCNGHGAAEYDPPQHHCRHLQLLCSQRKPGTLGYTA